MPSKIRTPWWQPFPVVVKGSPEARENLDNLDKEIAHLEIIYEDLKKRRAQARDLADPHGHAQNHFSTYSSFLDIVENQRRAEDELTRLREERLKAVLLAGYAYHPDNRGESFPYLSFDDKAKEFIQTLRERLLAVSTVAFFGTGITYSSVFSATRGSIGLMSMSYAAFAISFTICVFAQWVRPLEPPYSIIAYPMRRTVRFSVVFVGAFASFVGLVLMGISVAMLDLTDDDSVNQVDARINTSWGGIASLIPVVFGFLWGCMDLTFGMVNSRKLSVEREAARHPEKA